MNTSAHAQTREPTEAYRAPTKLALRPDLRFTVSARGKPPGLPVLRFLARHFPAVPVAQLDSVFGFVEGTSLYGGRVFREPELNPRDLEVMYEVGIGLRLPLSNHFVDEAEYARNRYFLERHHRAGNSVIVTNDDLARWIRRDYPAYRIEASVIKHLQTYARIDAALEIYDTAILPMECCEQPEFLAGIERKERITLFANAGCALTCPARICYVAVSRRNKGQSGGEWRCSQPLKDRELRGMVDFDLDLLVQLGFRRFKLLRSQPGGQTGF
jgi:hypothetical protein